MEKILVLGGTSFIGRNLVERLIEGNDFEITLYNRGRTNTHLFSDIAKMQGDRVVGDVDQLSNEEWDYVVDFSCYYPEGLEVVLDAIHSKVKRYIFISTCSVYDSDNDQVLKDESSLILGCTSEQRKDRTGSSYGNRKAECERIMRNSGLPCSILRPALVYGKYDPTDRFYYWPYQVMKFDDILMPESGKRFLSLTYVDDLVNAIIQLLNPETVSDVYNIVTIPQASILQTIDVSNEILNRNPQLVNASVDLLNKENVSQWSDMPLWLSSDTFTFSNSKAIEDLHFQPSEFKSSVRETIQYYDHKDWYKPKSGIGEKESQSLITKILNQRK